MAVTQCMAVTAGIDFDVQATFGDTGLPGPGAYEIKSTLGKRGISFAPGTKRFSRHRPKPMASVNMPGPGPGAYTPRNGMQYNAGMRMSKEMRLENFSRSAKSPGPVYKFSYWEGKRAPSTVMIGRPASAIKPPASSYTPCGADYSPCVKLTTPAAPAVPFGARAQDGGIYQAHDGDQVRFRLGCSPPSLGPRGPRVKFGRAPLPQRDLHATPGPGTYDQPPPPFHSGVVSMGDGPKGRRRELTATAASLWYGPGPAAYAVRSTIGSGSPAPSFGGGRPRNPRFHARAHARPRARTSGATSRANSGARPASASASRLSDGRRRGRTTTGAGNMAAGSGGGTRRRARTRPQSATASRTPSRSHSPDVNDERLFALTPVVQ